MYRHNDALRYARLITGAQGINLQKGQTLVIRCAVENAAFAAMVSEAAFQAGAGDVVIFYGDQRADRVRYQYAARDTLTDVKMWYYDALVGYLKEGACYLNIGSADPEAFAELDAEKVGAAMNAQTRAAAVFYDYVDRNENQWLAVGAAGEGWAKKLFPAETPQRAQERLWDSIYHVMRLDEPDAEAAWERHCASLAARCARLNAGGFTGLEIKSGLGTDLRIGLAGNAVWLGGRDTTETGVSFNANMPTEEVFTAPHCMRAEGTVVASMPLHYNGTLIEGLALTFRDGAVTEYSAASGEEALHALLSVDAGCRRLGEVALVSYSSPIRETGMLFYSTLFDENASCHLALGSAYPTCVQSGPALSSEEKQKRGLNQSASHVDFMFGTADLSVTGVRADGSRAAIFRDGEWSL